MPATKPRRSYPISTDAYSSGSSARKLYEPAPARKHTLPEEPKTVTLPEEKPQVWRNVVSIVCALTVAAMAFTALVGFTNLAALKRQNQSMYQQIEAIREDLNVAQQDYDAAVTPESVELYAQAHGMVKSADTRVISVFGTDSAQQ